MILRWSSCMIMMKSIVVPSWSKRGAHCSTVRNGVRVLLHDCCVVWVNLAWFVAVGCGTAPGCGRGRRMIVSASSAGKGVSGWCRWWRLGRPGGPLEGWERASWSSAELPWCGGGSITGRRADPRPSAGGYRRRFGGVSTVRFVAAPRSHRVGDGPRCCRLPGRRYCGIGAGDLPTTSPTPGPTRPEIGPKANLITGRAPLPFAERVEHFESPWVLY